MRTIPALLVTVGLVASLTACSSASGAGTSATCVTSGSASESVSATGKFGSKPSVDVPAGLKTKRTEVSTLRDGTGRELAKGTPALIAYTVIDGATGKVAQRSGYHETSSPITVGASKAGVIGKALACARVGSRIAIVTSKSSLSGGSSTSKKAKDSAVVVVDVKRAYDSRATGRPQLAADGMPAIVLAPNGAPGITVPSTNPPTDDVTHLLRKGSGAELTAKDTAVVKYTAVTWPSANSTSAESSVVGSSWTDGSGAVTLPLTKSGQVALSIRKSLIGTRVGDQVLAVLRSNGSSYVYVFDILGTLPR